MARTPKKTHVVTCRPCDLSGPRLEKDEAASLAPVHDRIHGHRPGTAKARRRGVL